MITHEIANALARFFQANHPPTHDDLDRHFHRVNHLHHGPRVSAHGAQVGKMKRVKDVLVAAIEDDPDAASKLTSKRSRGGLWPLNDN